MRAIRHILEYFLFLSCRLLLLPLSSKSVYQISRRLGKLWFRLATKRRAIGLLNLDIAFGDQKTRLEKNRILSESFIQQVLSLFQILWLSHDPEARTKELIDGTPEGLDVVEECRRRGNGILFLTAHYANWEVMGLDHGYREVAPLFSIARRLDNPHLERFVLALRTVSGNGILYRDQNPIKMVRALKRNQAVAVMMDQNAGDWGTFVDFFGKKASTARALALMSYNQGTPILPMFCHPSGDGRYRIVYGPELRLKKTGNKNEDVVAWTQACVKHLEWVISQEPEPWMWIHRRWKSRPEGEPRGAVYG